MKPIISRIAFAIFGCTSLAAQATAPDISWNYVSAGYAQANIKNISNNRIKPDGYQVNASYLLSETLYVAASYSDMSGGIVLDDILGMSLETSDFSMRLGMRQAATETIDAFFEAGYARTTVGVKGFERNSSNGFQAGAGFRYRAAPRLELAAAMRYYNGSDIDSATLGDLSARVRLTAMFDLYASYQFDSDVSLLATGVVLNF